MMIIVVGMPGSGKNIFVQAALDMGFSRIGMGDVVRHYAALSGLEDNDMSIGGFATSQRAEHGPAVWAQRTIDRMPPGNVVIDGSRSLDEISLFRDRLGDGLKVVAVTASDEARYLRLRNRRRQDDPMSMDDFRRRDERELSWGIGEAIASADLTLTNEGGIEDFKIRCMDLLRKLLDTET